MMTSLYLLIFITIFGLSQSSDPDIELEEIRARDFLQISNKENGERVNKLAIAEWNYASNITDDNLHKKLAVAAEVAKADKELWKEVQKFNWRTFSDPSVKRQFKKYSILGNSALSKEDFTRLNKITSDMQKVYSTVKLCDFKNRTKCDLELEPHLTEILTTSRNEEELKHIWVNWRAAIGPNVKNLYNEYVQLSNRAAVLNNFQDTAEYWLDSYEDKNFKNQVQLLWEQLRPLYLQIHAYTRFNLRKKYGDVVSEKGPIPAHLLGNMWAQTWDNVANDFLPFPNKAEIDVTGRLKSQNYTVMKIFKTAEEFFTSLNLSAMPTSFWENSILSKPNDREVICHASAWDFYDGKDFRIKQCTTVGQEHFTTAHHEMGHIQYFLQYKDQPIKFREGANDGFHEAIGDLIALSVGSTKHLRKLNLMDENATDSETILNNLYNIGMQKIVFLPFGYLMDLWRWDVFSGKITPENYNCKWWELREKYQGIEPPVDRSEDDFDPAAKYHIIADVPYLRYFVSFVIQFQFHRSLCEKAGEYEPNNPNKPLHECDIYKNTAAGNLLKQMLQLGSSKPWPEAIEIVTGQRTMDGSGLLEYFKPLQTWLEHENRKNNVHIGWEKTTKVCTSSSNSTTATPK